MTEKNKEEEEEKRECFQLLPYPVPAAQEKFRTIGLFGDLDEETVTLICNDLVILKDSCKEEQLVDPESPPGGSEIIEKPIDFYISTWGGDALGMFAIYDLMRMIREDCQINTFGIGKVMSAGVLLLAAGTKGQRKVGKHTRIMLHSIRGGHYGNIHSLENEMKETRWIQEQHISALVKETKMTKTQVRKMLNKKVDLYLSAEEAIKLGIADIIV
tara:strand:+ start:700 stop:1344 length:645 start_codon:yes stop_codon:yes gene_type:complete